MHIIESLDLDQNEDVEPVFHFTVQVKDNGKTIQHSATSDVILRMRRVNEFSPVIRSNGTSLTINENEAIGTVLYKVSKKTTNRFFHFNFFLFSKLLTILKFDEI